MIAPSPSRSITQSSGTSCTGSAAPAGPAASASRVVVQLWPARKAETTASSSATKPAPSVIGPRTSSRACGKVRLTAPSSSPASASRPSVSADVSRRSRREAAAA